jgi:predicted nucleic acid-binding protein
MRVVVDTNVVAYFLLGTEEFVAETSRFWRRVRKPTAPTVWEAELANVVWMAVRAKVLPPEEAPKRLTLAAGLGIDSVSSRSLWHGALARSLSSGVAVYDTLFVELAAREHLHLATFDARVLKSFPDIAHRPALLTGLRLN